jgi:hypothetical protein
MKRFSVTSGKLMVVDLVADESSAIFSVSHGKYRKIMHAEHVCKSRNLLTKLDKAAPNSPDQIA